MTTILIADNHEVVRCGLQALLAERPDWEVVAEAADGKEAVAQATKTTPDVAIIDYSLPFLNGVEVTRQIRQRSPDTAVIIFTMHDNNNIIHDFTAGGCPGLCSQIRCATPAGDGHRYGRAAQAVLHGPGLRSRVACLSDQWERQPAERPRALVVQLIAEGHSNKKIASILNLSVKTVESHRATARHKLELRSTADLVRYAIRNHLIEA